MERFKRLPSTYEVLRAHGVDRRTFLTFCSKTAALVGLSSAMSLSVVKAFVTQPRIPVIWLHGQECTCCTESLTRAASPILQDVILNMISLDYDMTLQAAAGFQAEQVRRDIMNNYPGQYLLAVEGSVPTKSGGVFCTIGGRTFQSILQETARSARAVVAWGSCSTGGCVQAASPNPTGSKPVSAIIRNKPVINVPGCPPIAEVMTGIIAYLLTYNRIPDLDSRGRPSLFYANTVHAACPRRPYFDAGQFVEYWDDVPARSGWCLYRMGCRGPVTHNFCSEIGFNELSFCAAAGHPCIGCSEDGFYDKGPFYRQSEARHSEDETESRRGD
jgi:hydrogenase small subunit